MTIKHDYLKYTSWNNATCRLQQKHISLINNLGTHSRSVFNKLLLKINFPMEKMNCIFTSGTRLLHSYYNYRHNHGNNSERSPFCDRKSCDTVIIKLCSHKIMMNTDLQYRKKNVWQIQDLNVSVNELLVQYKIASCYRKVHYISILLFSIYFECIFTESLECDITSCLWPHSLHLHWTLKQRSCCENDEEHQSK